MKKLNLSITDWHFLHNDRLSQGTWSINVEQHLNHKIRICSISLDLELLLLLDKLFVYILTSNRFSIVLAFSVLTLFRFSHTGGELVICDRGANFHRPLRVIATLQKITRSFFNHNIRKFPLWLTTSFYDANSP